MDGGALGSHPYRGREVALLTQHGKELVIAPPFRGLLAAEVRVVDGFDTDALGTFTREIPRAGSQLEAARRKARLAAAEAGLALGLGSEGSFGPGPYGLGTWNLELVVLVDLERACEVVGRAYRPGLHHQATVATLAALREAATRAGFPEHGLVVRPEGPDDPRVRKGLVMGGALEAAFEAALREAGNGRVFVENDLRAHQHPTRMATIAEATRDLVDRLVSLCPACAAPGFARADVVTGLPCGDCGAPTEEVVAEVVRCVACPERSIRPCGSAPFADPVRCPRCNP